MNKEKERLWSKSFIMLMLGNLFVFLSFQMLIPTLPPYIKSIGASGLEIGLVTALFAVGAVFIRPFIGHMLVYRKRKALVLVGGIALLAVTLAYPFSQVVIVFLFFRLIHGLAWGWSTTVNGTAAVDVIPNSRLGEGMGFFGLSATIALIIAPSLGIYLYQVTSFSNLIYISALLSVIAVILLAIVRYRTPDAVVNTKKEDLRFSYFGSLVEKTSWYPAFIAVIATFGYGSVVTFIVIFGEERGIDQIYLFYLFNAILATLIRPFAGRWFDKRGAKSLILVCLIITFAGMWVLSMAHSNLLIGIAGALFGLGFGSLIPTLQSWTLSQTPPHRRGVANGMYFSAIDIGLGLSGLVFGMLAQFLETATLFQISSMFLLVGIVLTLLEGRKKPIARTQTV
jgi:predicted MFS family arabinose efflux permease